jgi:hypothetical protein
MAEETGVNRSRVFSWRDWRELAQRGWSRRPAFYAQFCSARKMTMVSEALGSHFSSGRSASSALVEKNVVQLALEFRSLVKVIAQAPENVSIQAIDSAAVHIFHIILQKNTVLPAVVL